MENLQSRPGVTALSALAKIEVSEGHRHGGMVLFAAYGGGIRSLLAYRTLAEALAEGGPRSPRKLRQPCRSSA